MPIRTNKNIRLLIGLYRATQTWAMRHLGLLPKLEVVESAHVFIRLGSEYGGWHVVDDQALKNSTMISCGLGEDGSFDVEFARRYAAKVLIIDPTPRALRHFDDMSRRFGMAPELEMSKGGAIDTRSYDLRGLSAERMRIAPVAVWNKTTSLKFYAPRNPSHVSHSIINFQNDYRNDTEHIEVEADTLSSIKASFGVGDFHVLKLDIEGAEIEVIEHLIGSGIRPRQLLVEYDELSKPSRATARRIGQAHASLGLAGYQLLHREGLNFLYYRSLHG